MKKNKYLYIITISFFTLGFFNILFAWLGFLCLILPFLMLVKSKKKIWCQSYCPRSSFLSIALKKKSLTGKKAPIWLTKEFGKEVMLIYFAVNLLMIIISTIMVAKGRIAPIDKVRFLMAFQLPYNIPQLLHLDFLPGWVVHLSFRVYSMMFTSTVIGLLLGLLFLPRTWCSICPISSASDIVMRSKYADNHN